MAIRDKVGGGPVLVVYFFARSFFLLLGVGAAVWGGLFLPLFWQQLSPDQVTSEVLEGRTFSMHGLLDEAQRAAAADGHSSFCNPTGLHDSVVLRLAALNRASATANQTYLNSAYGPLYETTRAALACSPADPFVWLTLFWLEVGKHGYDVDDAKYLRLSYALGPNEGWIALWRCKLGIALFERLPADLANNAINDFIALLNTRQLYPETVAIYIGATAATRSRIAKRLQTAKTIPRQVFARMLYDRGLDVAIPGIDNTPARPWR